MAEARVPYSIKKMLDSPSPTIPDNAITFLKAAGNDKNVIRQLCKLDNKVGDTVRYPNDECWRHLFECLFCHQPDLSKNRDDSAFDYINCCYTNLDQFIEQNQLHNNISLLGVELLAAILQLVWDIHFDFEAINKIHSRVITARRIQKGIPEFSPLDYQIKDRVIDELHILGVSNENITRFEKMGDLPFLDCFEEIPVLLTGSDIAQIQMLEAFYDRYIETQQNDRINKWSDADLILWFAISRSGGGDERVIQSFVDAKKVKRATVIKSLNRLLSKKPNGYRGLKALKPEV